MIRLSSRSRRDGWALLGDADEILEVAKSIDLAEALDNPLEQLLREYQIRITVRHLADRCDSCFDKAIDALRGRLDELAKTDLPDDAIHKWALHALGNPRPGGLEDYPCVLAGASVRPYYGSLPTMILTRPNLFVADTHYVVAVLPRFVIDALLHSRAISTSSIPVYILRLKDSLEIKSAAAMWDPHSKNPLKRFTKALEAARVVHMPLGPAQN